jgi:hypothetical protein
VPPYVAGKNTANAISLSQLNPASIITGEDAYEVYWFNPNQPSARVYDWNLTVEKELMKDTVVRFTYIGTHLSHQDNYNDINQQIPAYVWYKTTGLPLPDDSRASAEIRPLSTLPYGDLHEYRRDGWGNTNGGIVELERRFSKGYGFQLFYQMVNANKAASHGWYGDSGVDPVSSYLPGQVPTDYMARMRALLYERDTTVPKHEIRFNWIMELPFGKGKALLHNAPKALDYIVGGWQVSGMGHVRSNYFSLPTDIWPTGTPVQYYGHKYPIQDCRSGVCQPGYLMWNGYIPSYQINQPGGILGVPANYKPAAQPINPYPANYPSLQGDDPSAPNYDPNYGYYGTNNVFVTLKDGTQQPIDQGGIHPWINQPVMSTRSWGTDASLFKNFKFGERMGLKIQADFFNVFNTPGNEFDPTNSQGDSGVVLTNYSMNSPRQLQLTARFSW